MVLLRPARASDAPVVADLWHRGWHDGHDGHVPPELVAQRARADFDALVDQRLALTTVACVDDRVVGFVTVRDDEVEQVYVDAAARGGQVAAAILDHGEGAVASGGFDVAWLAVVAGNARARRFYERRGWVDAGAFTYAAKAVDGSTISVPAHRYEKRVRG